MGTFSSWLRPRKTMATTVAISVLAGVPLTFAVLHQGFPVTDPDLRAREVWVTNGEELLAGRLNRQIEELDAAVSTVSNDMDVFQNGDDAFLYDMSAGSLERIDPAFTTLTQRIDVPLGSEIAYGGEVFAILSSKGELWTTPAGGELSFDPRGTDPVVKLGDDAQVAVTSEGVVLATSPSKKKLYRIAPGGGDPTTSELPRLGEHQLAAVGDRAVIFDVERNALVVDGRVIELPEAGLKLQQSGAEHDSAFVAAASALLEVPLGGGEVRVIENGAEAVAGSADEVAAPVWLNGCAHGAWATSSRYLSACDGKEPAPQEIEQPTVGSRLEFRVNRDVIVLNDLTNGNAWLVDSDLRLVDNWDEVTPPEESDELEGDEKSAQQTFEDTLAERTDANRPPLARDDEYGVRPGRTTVLEVLENDTDPDGDVLTVSGTSEVAESQGRLELIDGGRALQFTPAEGAAGTVSFRYGVDDGRKGASEASVNVRVVPEPENAAPVSLRSGAVSVEQGQQISYNVLADWIDPDGDDVFLVNASPTSGDSARFSPDGFVTFDHQSGELGLKEVQFTVSDGQATAAGVLTVDVKPTGALNPIGTPDFAKVFTGETVLVNPLENDLSPSGAPLSLLGVDDVPGGASVTPNLERGTIAFSANAPGEYIFLYNLGADAAVSVGLVRVQVVDPPTEAQPPIAVKDTAYLRPGEPTSVPVLANDVSPTGRVLAVQSVDDSMTDDLVSVEIITNTVARVTASAALDRQLQFSYTISDGIETATATVTVVPVPPLVNNQPPVALDDNVNVRAGDIVTVPVLDNDYHPDGAKIHVLPDLAEAETPQGLAFVSEDTVRFQAPEEAGLYSVVYTIGDDFEQTARAQVNFTVVAKDAGENRPPLPTPLTSRTFAGSAVKIDVPLDGLDPDGDSVVLTGIKAAPSLGRVADQTSTSFTYEAFAGSTGTDTFTYEVRDTQGEVAVGTIRIGVIPRPAVALPPKAVDDTVEMKPGRTASVEVLLNDSDPSGYSLKVTGLAEVDEGIKAKVREQRRVVVTAPEQEGAFTIRYEISNGHGGADSAFLQIAVKENAVILPPTAEDQVIEPEDVLDVDSVEVHPLDDATNAGGLVEDLVVSVEGPNANRAEVQADGSIVVRPAKQRFAVAYRLTNELDDLDAMAFVIVPPSVSATEDAEEPSIPGPHLADLGPIVIPMNGKISWSAADIVVVPSGNPALILSATSTNAGESAFVDGENLQYVPAKDYRGEASVTFEVTDGTSADDPKGRKAFLTIPITVGDPNFEDTPPVFTPRSETIEAGEPALQVDLRSSTDHPNPDAIQRISYSNLSGTTADIQATIDGGALNISAPLGVQPGTSTRLTFDVKFNEFTVPGYIDVKVVSSTRAMPQAVDDGPVEMQRSQSQAIDVLANDFNPFPEVPLRVVAAEIDQADVGSSASVSFTAEGITVRTGASFTGTLSVIYRIQDATKDPARETQGRATIIVRAAPDAPNAPSVTAGDASATVTWRAPASNNSPITDYIVEYNGGSKTFPASAAGVGQNIGGLTNGTTYTFTVRAVNAIGTSAPSPGTNGTPYGTPNAPQITSFTASGYAPADLTARWNVPTSTGGGSVTYEWRLDGGNWNSTTSRSATINNRDAGTYRIEVRAINNGSGRAGPPDAAAVGVSNPPKTVSLSKGDRVGSYSGPYGYCNGDCWQYNVSVSGFPDGTASGYAMCNGTRLSTDIRISVNGGRGSYTGKFPEAWCGYPDAYVVIDGVRSNNW
ncbi:tandem-95 repeat protein [Agromyces sp. ISL-38]|uniref:Ig-like domain-containing protein n=1 Tax=Agromyces sp. ISL-38 TaxID=2819107 RepID=UPI001BE8F615|nr:Ig-like domain-containing protein [Agromyces sp. ISL-38]MBT2499659.1 tandem-95 repeat protein [Agromyces sp. ISL-38]